MKRIALLVVFISAFFSGQAQMVKDSVWSIENYEWEEVPQKESREHITQEEEAVIQYTHLIEIRYEKEGAVMYELVHKRIWIGDEKVIQRYNKLYLPMDDESAVLKIKARVLLPDGSVTELNSGNIETGKDEDGNEYKYFTLNGVQEGSIVEYFFFTKEEPSFMGSRLTVQSSAPVYDLRFEFVTPSILLYKFKSYNALAQPLFDTVLYYQNRFFIHQDTLPNFEKEPSSFERAYMGYLIFALDENVYSGKRNISGFGNTAKNIYRNIHIPVSRKASKKFKEIIKESGIGEEKDYRTKLARLENYLKENYFISQTGADELFDLESILETHSMSEFGALRLYHLLFESAGFKNELVFTSDRSQTPFDSEFENNIYIRESFLYFPDEDVFMMPSNMTSRLDFFGTNYRNTMALFIHGNEAGEGVGEVKKIPALTAFDNRSELMIDWYLGADGELGEVQMERKSWGLQSNSFQTLSRFIQVDEMEEFRKAVIDWMYGEVDLKEYEVLNFEGADFPGKPLIAQARFSDEVYTEPGSTSTIIKVGDIIGPQSEMYLTGKERTLPVHHGFPKWYHRVIRVHIPEGYILKNAESLTMYVHSAEAKPLMIFKSGYTLKDNLLEIVIDEWYEVGDYPAEQFEIYRQVINAAADFNKKYLVLERNAD